MYLIFQNCLKWVNNAYAYNLLKETKNTFLNTFARFGEKVGASIANSF